MSKANENQPEGTDDQGTAPVVSKPSPPQRPAGVTTRLLVALALGVFIGRVACVPAAPAGSAGEVPSHAAAVASIWTCSMDPQVRQDGPGSCPICGMDLIPLPDDDMEGLDPASLVMSENAMALANISTTTVERRAVSREVRLVGKVTFDETRLSYITAWVPSRLDRLFVDYTGVSVRKGDHMADVYSPQLIATQQELLAAVEAQRLLGGDNAAAASASERQSNLVSSARDRLRLWGLEPDQIDAIVAGGVVQEHVTINSPASGVVIHKNALQGDQVGTGTRIYTIADLSKLWVQLDAYESDLAWLHYGQRVQFTTEAWPGEPMEARISFIDPVLDNRTRTIKVRLNVDNSEGRLKPDMFVRAVVHAPMTAHGVLVDAELAGLFMCPMHPEMTSAEQQPCDYCGMDLMTTEDLGFRSAEPAELPLVIPVTAALITGKQAVVYVRVPGTEKPTFEGRRVTLGPRAGDSYVVRSGLTAGEEVVISGAFKIDSELQIRARPSMMSARGPAGDAAPDEGAEHAQHDMPESSGPLAVPEEFAAQLDALIAPYLALQAALADDDGVAARREGNQLRLAFVEVRKAGLSELALPVWEDARSRLKQVIDTLAIEDDLELLRPAFGQASDALIRAFEVFGRVPTEDGVGVFHCPMALGGEGADWMSTGDAVRNPYYGESMLKCGSRLRDLGGEH
jgi:Cu(I)/Ag(I) efflux system membrane fusion protein